MPSFFRGVLAFLAVAGIAAPQAAPPQQSQTQAQRTLIPTSVQVALHLIQPDHLKGHVSFLSSDALEGRDTPSRGLDIAAEYIAAQFRSAGLETPPGSDSYFQIANWRYQQVDIAAVRASLDSAGKRIPISATELTIAAFSEVKADDAPVYKLPPDGIANLKSLPDGKLEGYVVLFETLPPGRLRAMSSEQSGEHMRRYGDAASALRRLKPKAVIAVRRSSTIGVGAVTRLIDPQADRQPQQPRPPFPYLIHSPAIVEAFDAMPDGFTEARMTFTVPKATEHPANLKNVIGVLPGSDPALKDSYIFVTAHYDHVGLAGEEDGDHVYNGANDDASGTAAVIETAQALSSLRKRPRRTLVFMTVFGEEKGLLGTYYYVKHPIFPLDKTVANINLEHMGRTDDNEEAQVAKATITGFAYSEVSDVLQSAGKFTGTNFYRRGESDLFFNRSDNVAFAEAGVPAHTICVAFEFPDYHALGDHWEKLDYPNFTTITRSVAAGSWMVANRLKPPAWNKSVDKTEPYRKARAQNGNKAAP